MAPTKKKKPVKKPVAKKASLKKKAVAPKAKASKKIATTKASQGKRTTPVSAGKKAAGALTKMATKLKSAVTSTFSSNKKNLLTPLEDRVLVQPDSAPEQTEGGLYIPGSASERPQRGTVLAKGPGRRNKKGMLRPLDVNIGDKVFFPQFAGQKIAMNDDELLILREEEILAISES